MKKGKEKLRGALYEIIDTPPLIVFPFGTTKEEIEEWEKDGFEIRVMSEEETKREKELEEKRNKEK